MLNSTSECDGDREPSIVHPHRDAVKQGGVDEVPVSRPLSESCQGFQQEVVVDAIEGFPEIERNQVGLHIVISGVVNRISDLVQIFEDGPAQDFPNDFLNDSSSTTSLKNALSFAISSILVSL